MNEVIQIEIVKGGFVVSTTSEGTTETEVVVNQRKLLQLVKEKLEKLSTAPVADTE